MLYFLENLKVLNINNKLPYPLLYATYNNKQYIIDGVKRTNKELINSNLSMTKDLDQIKFWLEVNLKHRSILDAEYIILINSINNFNWNKYLNESIIKEYIKCNKFNNNILIYLAKNKVSKNVLKYLYTVNKDILASISNLVANFEINPNNLKNLLEYSNDLYIKTNNNILNDTIFLKLSKEAGIHTSLKYLYDKRFSNLSEKRKNLKKITNNLKNIKLSFDNSFEDNNLNFSFNLKNYNDIDLIQEELIANKSTFLELIRQYNE